MVTTEVTHRTFPVVSKTEYEVNRSYVELLKARISRKHYFKIQFIFHQNVSITKAKSVYAIQVNNFFLLCHILQIYTYFIVSHSVDIYIFNCVTPCRYIHILLCRTLRDIYIFYCVTLCRYIHISLCHTLQIHTYFFSKTFAPFYQTPRRCN